MTLRVVLPAKWLDGPCSKVKELAVKHFNKKHDQNVAAEDCHLEIET